MDANTNFVAFDPEHNKSAFKLKQIDSIYQSGRLTDSERIRIKN
jgi:hypothetical protein